MGKFEILRDIEKSMDDPMSGVIVKVLGFIFGWSDIESSDPLHKYTSPGKISYLGTEGKKENLVFDLYNFYISSGINGDNLNRILKSLKEYESTMTDRTSEKYRMFYIFLAGIYAICSIESYFWPNRHCMIDGKTPLYSEHPEVYFLNTAVETKKYLSVPYNEDFGFNIPEKGINLGKSCWAIYTSDRDILEYNSNRKIQFLIGDEKSRDKLGLETKPPSMREYRDGTERSKELFSRLVLRSFDKVSVAVGAVLNSRRDDEKDIDVEIFELLKIMFDFKYTVE